MNFTKFSPYHSPYAYWPPFQDCFHKLPEDSSPFPFHILEKLMSLCLHEMFQFYLWYPVFLNAAIAKKPKVCVSEITNHLIHKPQIGCGFRGNNGTLVPPVKWWWTKILLIIKFLYYLMFPCFCHWSPSNSI